MPILPQIDMIPWGLNEMSVTYFGKKNNKDPFIRQSSRSAVMGYLLSYGFHSLIFISDKTVKTVFRSAIHRSFITFMYPQITWQIFANGFRDQNRSQNTGYLELRYWYASKVKTFRYEHCRKGFLIRPDRDIYNSICDLVIETFCLNIPSKKVCIFIVSQYEQSSVQS